MVYNLEKAEEPQVPVYYICSKGFESKEYISVKSDFELINISCCNFTLQCTSQLAYRDLLVFRLNQSSSFDTSEQNAQNSGSTVASVIFLNKNELMQVSCLGEMLVSSFADISIVFFLPVPICTVVSLETSKSLLLQLHACVPFFHPYE